MPPNPDSLDLETSLLLPLLHTDSSHAEAQNGLLAAEEAGLWISQWELLDFASATALRYRIGGPLRRA